MIYFAKYVGYFEVTPSRKPDHEEGLDNSNYSYGSTSAVEALSMQPLGIYTREPLDRVWIL